MRGVTRTCTSVITFTYCRVRQGRSATAGFARMKSLLPRFSLRAFFVFITVFGIFCGWLGLKAKTALTQQYAVSRIHALGGAVGYEIKAVDPFEPEETPWVRRLLGDDFFETVNSVGFGGADIAGKNLTFLKYLPHVEDVSFGSTGASDKELAHLKHLPRLETLNLFQSDANDAALAELKSLRSLTSIAAGRTRVRTRD